MNSRRRESGATSAGSMGVNREKASIIRTCSRWRELFSGISMDVRRGERICIVGDNGTGKTTLLRILMGDLTGMSATLLDRSADYMAQIKTMEITFRYEPRK